MDDHQYLGWASSEHAREVVSQLRDRGRQPRRRRLVDRILTIALQVNFGSDRLPFHLALLHHQPKAGVSLGGSDNSFEMTII
ncbi:hypothetical protein ACCT14_31540 [Rhizobium brockwellii]|uniref:hypothetical protein n=1 Tax=Rhizobium brockwellii TaxID=3019932 RepID=UPI003F9BEF61